MNLENVMPRRTSFKLSVTGNTYYMRPVNLADECWLKQEFDGKMYDAFHPEHPDFNVIARIVYNQIENREDFKTREVMIIDEDGSEQVVDLGGYRLLAEMVIGSKEKLMLLNAINECLGISRPNYDPKKKTLVRKLTGWK